MPIERVRTCVIGGAGFIGANVTRQLVRAGREVVVLGRRATPGATLPPEAVYVSGDYADRAVVLPAADWGWDDVGSWESLSRWLPVSEEGNVKVGDCRLEACDQVIAFSDGGLVAALGVSGLVIVRAGDATLVAARDRLDEIRSFVRRMTGGNGA